jgi:hypothetical protein
MLTPNSPARSCRLIPATAAATSLPSAASRWSRGSRLVHVHTILATDSGRSPAASALLGLTDV